MTNSLRLRCPGDPWRPVYRQATEQVIYRLAIEVEELVKDRVNWQLQVHLWIMLTS